MSQMKSPQKLSYAELSVAPQTSGIYAWYASLKIGARDLEEFRDAVESKKIEGEDPSAYVEERLNSLLFRKYREDDYQIALHGALKPKYEGLAQHIPRASSGVVDRLIEDPSRLKVIAESIATAAPFFTAPLYIGMARNLRERLAKHKQIIESLYDSLRTRNGLEIKDGDAGFARQVVARGFDPMSLFVYVQEIDVRTNEQVDVESILNRINFPIFGRN